MKIPLFQPDPGVRTRRYLTVAWLLTVVGILLLSVFGRSIQLWLNQNINQIEFAYLVGFLLVAVIIAVVRWLAQHGLKGLIISQIIVTLGLLAILILITIMLPRIEERIHFITFGLFGFITGRLFSSPVSILIIAMGAGGDELLQAWLPDRVGDWRDVGMNIVAAVIGIALVWYGSPRNTSNR